MLIASHHWGLAIIDTSRKIILFYDPLMNVGHGSFITKHVLRWMNLLNGKNQFQKNTDFMKWQRNLICEEFPQQKDAVSCGIFVLFVIDFIQPGIRPNFTQDDVVVSWRRASSRLTVVHSR